MLLLSGSIRQVEPFTIQKRKPNNFMLFVEPPAIQNFVKAINIALQKRKTGHNLVPKRSPLRPEYRALNTKICPVYTNVTGNRPSKKFLDDQEMDGHLDFLLI